MRWDWAGVGEQRGVEEGEPGGFQSRREEEAEDAGEQDEFGAFVGSVAYSAWRLGWVRLVGNQGTRGCEDGKGEEEDGELEDGAGDDVEGEKCLRSKVD